MITILIISIALITIETIILNPTIQIIISTKTITVVDIVLKKTFLLLETALQRT